MHSPTPLFDWVLATSTRASLLTVAVLIVQFILRKRVPARWRYALWMPVLAVLLTPAFPESPWSVESIIHSSPTPSPAPAMMQPAPTSTLQIVAAHAPTAPIAWRPILSLAWLTGAAGVALSSLGAFVQTLRRFQRSTVPVSDALLLEVATLARQTGLPRCPRVCMSPEIRSPAVTGLFHPTLLLPANFEETLTAQEARFVLKHELTHIKRGDLPLNALLCLLLSLHWFNPLLWLAFLKARLDREAACDADVLDHAPQPERVAYGHTLLKVENAFGHQKLRLGFVGIFQRGTTLRSRIQCIAAQPTLHPFMKTTLAPAIALLTFLGITKAVPPDNKAPQVLIEARFIEASEEVKDLLSPFASSSASPSIAGVLTSGELSTLWKKIETAKGVDVLSTPRITTLSGRKATIDISREFAYINAEGKPATKNLGTMLTVLPIKGAGNEIELELSPQIVQLEGMTKAGGKEPQPVFNERKTTTLVTMFSGGTLVLGLPSTTKNQTPEDRPASHATTTTAPTTKHIIVFVTAHLIDPASGQLIEPQPATEKSPLQAKLDAIVIPQVQFQNATLTEAVEFLRRRSIDLDTTTTDPTQKGVNIVVKPDGKSPQPTITLNLNHIPLGEALKYVAQLSNLHLAVERFAVTLLPQPDFEAQQKSTNIPPAAPAPQAQSPAEAHARAIILPNVQFKDASLTEAVEFIRIKSRELDPQKKGLNILVKPGGDPKAEITLQFSNISAHEALRYCAEIAGHQLSVDGDVHVITPTKIHAPRDPNPGK